MNLQAMYDLRKAQVEEKTNNSSINKIIPIDMHLHH